MKRIGVRELRQNASKWLELVKGGEVVTVCERGKPVAKLVPYEREDPREALYEAGVLTRATLSLRDVPPPQPPPPGAPTSREVLDELGRD